tara:strand:+ start:355 stop:696 length:342 start_codon:yes stop_codon:yes gene_type:complete
MAENIIITNPILHRQKDRAERTAYYDKHGKDNVIFDTLIDTDIPNDLWVCDFCNVSIEVVDLANQPKSIWVHLGYALCGNCVDDIVSKEDNTTETINSSDVEFCNCCVGEDNE